MIRAEHIPMEVKLRLRAILHDGETDEAKAIAAALNAWPGGGLIKWPAIFLPLPNKEGDA
jgi:hypothetical protein